MSQREWRAPIRDEAQRIPLRDRAWEREQQLVTQRALLERLRYQRYARAGSLSSLMQRVGDWGRAYLPFIGGGGWNGVGGTK